MSKYTTELRYICETYAGLNESVGYTDVETVIESARPKLFDFTYPLYEGADKKRLETAIISAYYTREIGFESVGLFKLKLMSKMRQIMPYFNQLYESADLKYNPLNNVNYTEIGNAVNNGSRDNSNDITDSRDKSSAEASTSKITQSINETDTTSNNGKTTDSNHTTNSGDSTRSFSDTPQGGLTGVQNNEYLTEAEYDTVSNNTQMSGSQETISSGTTRKTGNDVNDTSASRTATEKEGSARVEQLRMQERFVNDSLKEVKGKIGGESFSKLIMEYRETILNIDAMIVEKCEDLFMMVW